MNETQKHIPFEEVYEQRGINSDLYHELGLAAAAGFQKQTTHESPLPSLYRHSEFDFRVPTRMITTPGKSQRLTVIEGSLLTQLFKNIRRVTSYEHLIESAWGIAYMDSGPTLVKGHLKGIRDKLELISVDPDIIQTITKEGVLLEDTAVELNEKEFELWNVEEEVYHHPDFDLFPERFSVAPIGSDEFRLPYVEFKILEILARNENHIVKRSRILEYAWDGSRSDDFDETSLKTHISRLRKKIFPEIAPRGYANSPIVTINNAGIMLMNKNTAPK